MKLRIKGNSLRIRLSKSEVDQLVSGSTLTDQTEFGKNSLRYMVQTVNTGEALEASYENNLIALFVPNSLIENWDTNATVGFESMMTTGTGNLHLLLEKDFKCIDKTTEDQSDFFENPAKTC